MFKGNEDKFVCEALEVLRAQLLRMGVAFFKSDELNKLRPAILKIGKRYHEMEKQEEL